MIMLENIFLRVFFRIFVTLVAMGIQISTAVAQFDSESSYEVMIAVPVVNSNFFQARKKAVKMALKSALEQDLREFLGGEEFEHNQREIQRMLMKPEKYIKSYRFLEAYDDPLELVSKVKLIVVLSQDAVNNYLNQIGVTSGFGVSKQVVILINESSLISASKLHFWEAIPVSEISLTRNFVEEGIPVVGRSIIRYAIPEEMVMDAMKGDLSAASNIGLKVGADIVIVGNATSSFVTNGHIQSLKPVRVAISIKAVSSQNSTLIAAKSDFATTTENEVLKSELKAFHRAGKKITEFLIPAIQRHWEADNKEWKAGNREKEVRTVYAPNLKIRFLNFTVGRSLIWIKKTNTQTIWVIVIVTLLLAVIFFYFSRRVLTPFFIAFALAYLLDPVTDRLESLKISRTFSQF